jgi:hypothetical protein
MDHARDAAFLHSLSQVVKALPGMRAGCRGRACALAPDQVEPKQRTHIVLVDAMDEANGMTGNAV